MKRIFVQTDIEGCAGIVSHADQSYSTGRYNDQAKRLATAELNAAIEGFLEAGVEDVLVSDGHGSGGIWFEDLHPAARLIHGRPSAPRSVVTPIVDEYEAMAIVGQHAMAGVPTSNQNHTQSSTEIDWIKLNGAFIGEIAQGALFRGAAGMPLIFLSGEEDACKEAEALVPGIVTANVKKGLSRNAAISLAAQAARDLIRRQAKLAVEQHRRSPLQPVVWPGPYVLEKRFFQTDRADTMAAQPGVERVDGKTVRVRGDDIREVIYR